MSHIDEVEPTRRDGDLLRNPTATFWLAVALLAVVATVTVLTLVNVETPPLLHRLDRWWRDIVQPPAAWAESVSEVLYYIGNSWTTIPFRVAIGIWLGVRRRWIDLAAWLGAWAIADLLTAALKIVVEQPRPDGSDMYAFPSGHAKSAAQISVGLVLLAIPPWRPRWPGWVACTLWIAVMAWSRTILDKHWASDVITGALLGTGAMLLAAAAAQRYRDRRSKGPTTQRVSTTSQGTTARGPVPPPTPRFRSSEHRSGPEKAPVVTEWSRENRRRSLLDSTAASLISSWWGSSPLRPGPGSSRGLSRSPEAETRAGPLALVFTLPRRRPWRSCRDAEKGPRWRLDR